MHIECQDDGEVAWSEDRKLLEYHRGRGIFYPLIQVRNPASSSTGQPPVAENSCKHDSSASSRNSVLAAFTGGILLCVYELCFNRSGNPLLRALISSIVLFLVVLNADRVRPSRKNPQSAHGLEQLLASLLGILAMPADRSSSKKRHAVKAISWHPYLNTFAIALMGDSSEHVAFYDMDLEQWQPTVVKHEFQRAISCLQFQPKSGGNIAVACQQGIALWHFEPARLATTAAPVPNAPDAISAWMSWLHINGFQGTQDISWSPCGRFLVAAYASSDCPVVWDVCSKTPTPLQSFVPLAFLGSLGGGVERVEWSPAGTRVLASSRSGLVAIYETRSWTFSRHRHGSQGNVLVDAAFRYTIYLLYLQKHKY